MSGRYDGIGGTIRAMREGAAFQQEVAKDERAARAAVPRDLAWCRNCEQNVRPVRRPRAGRIVAFGLIGHLLTKPTACPICKAENLAPARQVSSTSSGF